MLHSIFFVIYTGQNNTGIRMKPDPPETGVKKDTKAEIKTDKEPAS